MPYPALIGMARRLATHWCVCVSASAEKTQKIGQMALGFHAPHCQQCCCMICMRTPLHVPMHMNMGLLRPYYHNCEMECSYACRAPPQQPSNLQNLPKNCYLWEPMWCFRKAKAALDADEWCVLVV